MSSRLRYEARFHRYAVDGRSVPSVTGITGMLNKPALPPAAAKETALWALHNRDLVDQLGSSAWLDTCGRAYRTVWNKSRDVGTDLHAHAESLITTGYADVTDEQRPYVEVAADFLDRWDVQPVHTEAAVYHQDHWYAGRLDSLAELADGDTWLLDYKTGKSGVWPEMCLQAAGYRYASHLVNAAGDDIPMPSVDKVGVVHVRPHGWELVPLVVDREAFGVFLALQAAWDWNQKPKDASVLAPLPHPEVA